MVSATLRGVGLAYHNCIAKGIIFEAHLTWLLQIHESYTNYKNELSGNLYELSLYNMKFENLL